MDPILELVMTDTGHPTTASWRDRPTWVFDLGPYGRAAYEWRRQMAPSSLEPLEKLRAELQLIDRTVADHVRSGVQEWLQARRDPGIVLVDPPAELIVAESDQVPAATRAIEIRPCLELVFQPAPNAPGAPTDDGIMPTLPQRDLLMTETWELRPDLDDLRQAAAELAQAIDERHSTDRLTLLDACRNCLTEPTALFPTEIRVATQSLRQHLGRPIDLYLVFD
jgi:hypothetical protein